MNSIKYFFAQSRYNIKNAHALSASFWTGVIGMVLNNLTFFIIWMLFMQATGPINGWTSFDVFGMLGASIFCYGIMHSFFYGIVDLPDNVLKGSFDTVLLSPVNAFLKLSSSSFSITAYGDLLQGVVVMFLYGILSGFGVSSWIFYISGTIAGCVVLVCFRLLGALVAFFMNDSSIISRQLFELFLRPSLYPGAVFPRGLKIFFMTALPTLLTSAVPIYILKGNSAQLLIFTILITLVWVLITYAVFRISIRRYESGNYLR